MVLTRLIAIIPVALVCAASTASAQTPPTDTPEARLARWQQTNPGDPIRAHFAFDGLVPDVQVRQFLERYNLKPVAIHMAAAGQVGTHRVSPAKASAAAVAEARQATLRIGEGAAKTSKLRAARYLERMSEAKIASDSVARRRARSFLAAVEQDSALRQVAMGNAPVIYGVEVIGSVADLTAASKDVLTRGFEPAANVNGRPVVPTVPLPANVRPSTSTPATDRLNPQEIHARLQALAARP